MEDKERGSSSASSSSMFVWEKRELMSNLLLSTDTFLFDLDGVVWAGNRLLPGAVEFLEFCKKNQKKAIFVSNNSTKSRRFVVERFRSFGIEIEEAFVYTSSYAAAAYLKNQNFSSKAYVLGGLGVEEELARVGIDFLGGTKEDLEFNGSYLEIYESPLDPDVGAVIAGLDINLNYKRLAAAQGYIMQGATFLATNADVNYPFSSGKGAPPRLLPGGGTMISALETCSKQKAKILGKPESYIFELIEKEHVLSKEKTIFVGDNLLTDILFGNRLGIQTIFVTSGVSKFEDMEKLEIFPTYVSHGLSELMELFSTK